MGLPVVFLHGGPGGGCSPRHRQFFDPAFYRIVMFDQRGAGHSTPVGEVRDNTKRNLVGYLEKLRRLLEIEHWLVLRGRWGLTGGRGSGGGCPKRCLGVLLRRSFLR